MNTEHCLPLCIALTTGFYDEAGDYLAAGYWHVARESNAT